MRVHWRRVCVCVCRMLTRSKAKTVRRWGFKQWSQTKYEGASIGAYVSISPFSDPFCDPFSETERGREADDPNAENAMLPCGFTTTTPIAAALFPHGEFWLCEPDAWKRIDGHQCLCGAVGDPGCLVVDTSCVGDYIMLSEQINPTTVPTPGTTATTTLAELEDQLRVSEDRRDIYKSHVECLQRACKMQLNGVECLQRAAKKHKKYVECLRHAVQKHRKQVKDLQEHLRHAEQKHRKQVKDLQEDAVIKDAVREDYWQCLQNAVKRGRRGMHGLEQVIKRRDACIQDLQDQCVLLEERRHQFPKAKKRLFTKHKAKKRLAGLYTRSGKIYGT